MRRAEFWRGGAAACALLGAIWPFALDAATCTNADPLGLVTNVNGDFELNVDPQDASNNVLFTSNTTTGSGNIVVARIDGQTGQVTALTTVATNFYGKTSVNGPEWYQKPTGELGMLYAGIGGVHAIFRSANPPQWDAFLYDVNGAPVKNGAAPVLFNTTDGAYPALAPPLLDPIYGQWLGACQSQCYGGIQSTQATDISVPLAAEGLTYTIAAFNGNRSRYVFISACDASQNCGIYEAAIDDNGGFMAGTFKKLISTQGASQHLASGRHPVTGDTVLFSQGTKNGSDAINVWRQPATGGGLTLLSQVPVVANTRHYGTLNDATRLVMIYEVTQTSQTVDTYTIAVSASGSSLVVGSPKKISAGSTINQELVWFPAINQWAAYYKNSSGFTRCWINP